MTNLKSLRYLWLFQNFNFSLFTNRSQGTKWHRNCRSWSTFLLIICHLIANVYWGERLSTTSEFTRTGNAVPIVLHTMDGNSSSGYFLQQIPNKFVVFRDRWQVMNMNIGQSEYSGSMLTESLVLGRHLDSYQCRSFCMHRAPPHKLSTERSI